MGNIQDNKYRRSIRLKGYDYSQAGLYFITICTQQRVNIFGEIENGEMVLNDAGKMINKVWNEIPVFYIDFATEIFQIMPNHIHGIIQILNNPNPVGAGPVPALIINGNQMQQGNHRGLPLRCHYLILFIGLKH